ncbi:response regulator [Caenimonas terrae]|uniref:Response regulator n=1 Tax=Caenimonas terrae TaxID=696074 RepID=A0ABW0NBT2_9BURK
MNAPLDEGRLDDVLRGTGVSAAAFLADFRHCTDVDVEQLLAAVAGGDLVRAEQLAHRIEGASRVIGAQPIARACAAMSEASRALEPARLRLKLDAFLLCQSELYAWIEALDPSALRPGPGAGGGPVCAGLNFLVVDDHEFQRSMILRLLRQLGALDVRGFADGAGALAAARELAAPAILVLDLAMPSLDGMEVMRIVADERLPLSVIMNSALADDLLRWPLQAARSYGTAVLGAVSKPLTAAKLAPLLAQHRHNLRPLAGSPGAPPAA